MRKTLFNILSVFFALSMILTVIPTAFASGNDVIPYVTRVVEGSKDITNMNKKFVAIDGVIYDANGTVVEGVDFKYDSQLRLATDHCIVVERSYKNDLGGTYTLHDFYEVSNGKAVLKHKNMYSTIEFRTSSGGFGGITNYTGTPYFTATKDTIGEYEYYDILNEYGDIVYTEHGNKIVNYHGNDIFTETDLDAQKTTLFTLQGSTKVVLPCSLTGVFEITAIYKRECMLVRTYHDNDYHYMLCKLDGKKLLDMEYPYIKALDNGYFVGYLENSEGNYYAYNVYDSNGRYVYASTNNLSYFNGKIAVETLTIPTDNGYKYDYRVINVMTGDILYDEVSTFSIVNDHILIAYESDEYNDIGYPITYEVLLDPNCNIVVKTPIGNLSYDKGNGSYMYVDRNTGITTRYNSDGVAVEEYSPNIIATAYRNNVVLCSEIKMPDGPTLFPNVVDYLAYKGVPISAEYENCTITRYIEMDDSCIFSFEVKDPATGEVKYYSNFVAYSPFSDVSADHWSFPYVKECFDMGLMNGTGSGAFSPNMQVSRAQVVTTLWRLAGSPAPKNENIFGDVADGQWYTDAITWAAENAITTGVGGNYFAPDRAVTRAEVAAIIYRFATATGVDTSGKADISSFPDVGKLADWSRDAFAWCAEKGIITGKSSAAGAILAPADVLTRAELAAVLCRY